MIITPQQLWKDYDRFSLDLNKTVLSQEKLKYTVTLDSGEIEEREAVCQHIYFNGEKTSDGIIRIFASLYIPVSHPTEKGFVIMDDTDDGVSFPYTNAMSVLKNNSAVLILDYKGVNDNYARYTMYPKSLNHCNYYLNPKITTTLFDDPKMSVRYIWTLLALRSVTLLENEGFKNIGMLGIGNGSSQVFKVAYFENTLHAAAVLYSGDEIDEDDYTDADESVESRYLGYKAALDPISYAPYLKCPLFMQITSNEQNSSFQRMNDIYESAKSRGALLAISESSNLNIVKNQSNNINQFILNSMNNYNLISAPRISYKESDKNLYFELSPDTSKEIESVYLFVSRGEIKSSLRSWQKQPFEKIGATDYIAKAEVFSVDKPLYAFATVCYKNFVTISTEAVRVNPQSINISPSVFSKKRRIYDEEAGTDQWLMVPGPNGDDGDLLMENGPFDIRGVVSTTGRISTFIMADERFCGNADSVLQLTCFSALPQVLEFSITTKDYIKFKLTRNIDPSSDWTRFTFNSSDFRSSEGVLDSFEKVITFEVCGEQKFLINSMLWV